VVRPVGPEHLELHLHEGEVGRHEKEAEEEHVVERDAGHRRPSHEKGAAWRTAYPKQRARCEADPAAMAAGPIRSWFSFTKRPTPVVRRRTPA